MYRNVPFVILIMFFSWTLLAVQVSANDDITGHEFEWEMRSLESMNIMNGDGTGNFFPDKKVTRGQFAALLNRALQLPATTDVLFTDTIDHPLAAEIHNVAAAGIINGVGDGKFLPDKILTREEVALMVSRVLLSKGLVGDTSKQIPEFTDVSQIKYLDSIYPVLTYEIMEGYTDQTFRPQEEMTRAQTAAVIYKMYNLLEKEEEKQHEVEEQETENEETNVPNEQEQSSDDLSDQEDYDVNDSDKEHIVIATKLLNVYEDGMKRVRTYVNAGTEMKFLKLIGNRVQVEVAGANGFVNADDVDIIPEDEMTNRSYYKVVDGQLRHYVIENGEYGSYIYGPAPSFLDEGEEDYSFDGINFTKGTYFQYFHWLPLLSETSYSAEDLDEYIRYHKPDSPLVGLGEEFKKAEKETGVNALYLLAHAIHESAWGTSKIAQEKYNLYGIRAIDADAYNTAMEFESFEDGILYAAKYVKENYLIPGDKSFYNGSFLGHKGVGVNLFYASDPNWGQKIAGRMYSIDLFLGQKDWNRYSLAISNVPSLNVRNGPSTNEDIQYKHRYAGVTMIVLEEIQRSDGTWFKIKSDHPDHDKGYIYAYGEKGDFAEIIHE